MLCVLIRTRRLCQPYKEQEIAFSLEESFYSEDQELQLSTLLDSDIYFTMDGSLPDKNAQLYREPVKLTAGKEPKAVTIRAAAYYGEGAASEIYKKTYFLGNEIEERFSTKIVSITGEPESFYGYDQGILVPGRIRDEYVFLNPGVEFTDTAPDN